MTTMRSSCQICHQGFTLVEFVVTIVLIGILSAAVMISTKAKAQHSVTVQADQLRRDLSHLQLIAISQGVRLQIAAPTNGGSYSVCAAVASPCNSGAAIADPVTREAFSVTLTDGVTFSLGGTLYFDSLGRPVQSAAGGALLLTGESSLTLAGSSRSVSVAVLPVTGLARTSY